MFVELHRLFVGLELISRLTQVLDTAMIVALIAECE
jgi:hypothetical protein